jgi:hypothetical protein
MYLVDPCLAVRVRRWFNLPDNLLTGGIYYASPKITRMTATLVAIVSLLGMVNALIMLFELH